MTLAAAARAGVATTTLVLITGCTSTTDEDPDAAQTSPTASAEPSAAASAVLPAVRTGLGSFPAFPTGRLPVSVAASLQAVLDQAVADDIVRGATASVIVAGSGSWAGAAGVGRQGGALRVDSRLLTASVGKTVTAAQILRLVDDGKLTLDDRASDYFPARLSAFDANDATVRDLLGMRSGLADPDNYGTLVARGLTTPDLMARADPPFASAGSTIQYANLNFLMLGEIIEQVAGRPLAQVMRAGVLAHPDLGGLSHDGAKNAMAADGWHMRTDPATLARWGYELYGGGVVSPAQLGEMTDFGGEWYGLGVIDFTNPDAGTFDTPAIGHGGGEESNLVRLVAFLRTGLVISVQANADEFSEVDSVLTRLRQVVQPS